MPCFILKAWLLEAFLTYSLERQRQRQKIARLQRLLGLFENPEEVLTLAQLRERHSMHLPKLNTLRITLAELGIHPFTEDRELPEKDQRYSFSRFLKALRVLEAPLESRLARGYREQAALAALILTQLGAGAQVVDLAALRLGRTTAAQLGLELARMGLEPVAPNSYSLDDLIEATRRWVYAPGVNRSNLAPELRRVRRRLG